MILEKNFLANKSVISISKKVLYLVVLIAFLVPRILTLGIDMSNSDALRWHDRSENFLNALKRGDFKSTYQRYHPGVILMWIGATASQVLLWTQQNFSSEIKTYGNADFYPVMHGLSKILVVLVLFVCLSLQLFFIRELFGDRIALLYGFFVAVEPYLVGINRWFHLSSLEAFFAFVSILSVLEFLKTRKSIFIVISAIFSGLGVLTKMTVFITACFVTLLIVYECVRKKLGLQYILIYVFAFIFTFFIFFPALWVDPLGVASKMYNALFNAVVLDPRGDLLSTYAKVFYYPLVFLFKSSPLLVISSLYSMVVILKKGKFAEKIVLLYFASVLLVLSFADQKIDRYVIALFLPMILLMSRTVAGFNRKLLRLFVICQLLFFTYATFCYYPVYSAYISPLVGFRRVLSWGLYENSGEYYANAALYLNTKGREVSVYVPNNIYSFKPYYKGKITSEQALANYIVYGLDFDRKQFPIFVGCSVERYFGNKVYFPVAVYRCTSGSLSFVETKTTQIY